MKDRKSPMRVFIVGCPRSGTTLVQSMLCGSGLVYSPPETHFFSIAYPRNSAKSRVSWPALNTWRHFIRLTHELGHPDLVRSLSYSPFSRRWSDAFIALLDEVSVREGCSSWVEKTPRHLHFIDEITKRVPGARFVHVLRDGPPVVASLHRATRTHPREWGGKRSLRECVARWNEDLLRSANHKSDPCHSFVRFEDILSRPEQTIRALCEELDLPYSPAMLEPNTQFARVVRPTEPWKALNARGIDRRRALNRPDLNDAELQFVREHLISMDLMGGDQ